MLFLGHLTVILKTFACSSLDFESRQVFGKVRYGYVLKHQTNNSYRLTLVQELPLMHDVTRAVISSSKEEAQYLSSTITNDASLCCDFCKPS
jgi:hypothetical protein